MKILFLITSVDIGGAEMQLLYLAKSLEKRGHKCFVVSLCEPKVIVEKFTSIGIRVYSLGMKKSIPNVCTIFRFSEILKKHEPNIIHSHMIHANLYARFARLFYKFKLINTAHSVYEGGVTLNSVMKYTNMFCDMVTHVSKEGLEEYRKKGLVTHKKSMFIRNSVDVSMLESAPYSIRKINLTLKFVFVGRLENVKGIENLIKAVYICKHQDIHLTIIGGGSLRYVLIELADELGVSNKIKFAGAVDNVTELLPRFDVFILSSFYEGMPISVLEAMASGLAIISTRVGAIPDLIHHNVNGYIVGESSPENIANGISWAIKNKRKCLVKMGKISKGVIMEKYSSDVISGVWEAIYTRIIDGDSIQGDCYS